MSFTKNFVSEEKGLFSSTLFGFLPTEIKIPFNQGKYIQGIPVVKVGDTVKEGHIIATTRNGMNIHSSIPGTVTEISTIETADGLQCMGAVVSLKGSFSYLGRPQTKKEWKLTPSQILRKQFDDNGIINTFNTASRERSLSSEIEAAQNRKRKTIVCVRLFDDDPSRVTESYVSENFWDEVLEGAAIIAKASNAESIVFVRDSSVKFKFEIGDAQMKSIFASLFDAGNVKVIETDGEKYPSGLKSELVRSAKKQFKPASNSSAELNHKDLFVDSLTCFSVYNAVILEKPFVSQFVHLTGSCLKSSSIMNIRIGTKIKDLVEQSGGFRRKLETIVINGVVRGCAVDSLEIPVTKEVKSISFLAKNETSSSEAAPCTRCGNCRKVCPEALEPDSIFHLFNLNTGKLPDDAMIQSALLCSECSLCNTVCSSRIPLSQTISIVKKRLKNGETI